MLTDTTCRTAKPKEKPYKLTDGHGLYLEVKPNGVKAWRFRYELPSPAGRKETVFAIGVYANPPKGESQEDAQLRRNGGALSLAEARLELQKARALVKQGLNPSQQRKLERVKRQQQTATTFEAVAREWVALKDWEEVTKSRRLDMLQRVVFPKIGALPVSQVTSAHVLDVLKTTAKVNGLTVVAEARRSMSGVFELAISTLRAESDPVYPVRKALPPNKTQHKRPLGTQEIGLLLRDVESHGGRHETMIAFRLMWLTLCRPNEAVEAEWSEFDLETAIWRIPVERMKKRKEHIVPLPTQAVEMLKTLHGLTGRHKHLFPHRDDRTKPMVTASFRQMLNVLGWGGKFSPHATRATGSTRLHEQGFNTNWIERQLAHDDQNKVRSSYNGATYFPERVKMMQSWADFLDGLKQGANIIPLKAA